MNHELKQQIWKAVEADRGRFDSASKHATYLGISPAAYSQLAKGKYDKTANTKWQEIARLVRFQMPENSDWITAKTPTYQYITNQLELAKNKSLASIFCDKAGIGKTYTAREFSRTHANVAYIDCSVTKHKIDFVRALAKEFGVAQAQTWKQTLADLVSYLKSSKRPLIILDEAGDLEYTAFLELKALYNQLEFEGRLACGFYMMGADGLRAKIERNIKGKKVGYTEIFDRFGDRFQSITPAGDVHALVNFNKSQASAIIAANSIGIDNAEAEKLLAANEGLRRLRINLEKRRAA
jgi:hypothetical protein